MNALRRHLHALSRIALLAMVALALLPTVAQAFAQARGGHALTEICTPQGMKLVVVDADASAASAAPVDAAKAALGHLDHCPFCATAVHAMAPPPAAPKLLLPAEGAAAAPLFLQAPRGLHAWLAAHPRGPPALS